MNTRPLTQYTIRQTLPSQEAAEAEATVYLERYPPEGYGTLVAVYPSVSSTAAYTHPGCSEWVFEGWHGSAG